MGAESVSATLPGPMSLPLPARALPDPDPSAGRKSAAPWQDWLF